MKGIPTHRHDGPSTEITEDMGGLENEDSL
jgi:hypothetical protein